MVKAKKYVVKNHFRGLPKREDFEVVEFDLPPLENGEILVKTEWISVDPYVQVHNPFHPVPYDQHSFQVGTVQDSKNPNYPIGSKVVSYKGWCDYSIIDNFENGTDGFDFGRVYKLQDVKDLPVELFVGTLGMTGVTAYCGLLEICQPRAGETVVVTGAAGAVGSIVGQIAKVKGCRVVGFAGSDEKVQWLENELGFDKAINYKTADLRKSLKKAAPNGVDCYFDNVGGEISSVIIAQMNKYGRVAVCGSISAYNDDPEKLPKATILQPYIIFNELRIEGLTVNRWSNPDRWPKAIADLSEWIRGGKIQARNHVTEGFDKLFDALIGVLTGDNFGKAVVKV
ncbi:unnamed protein product [Leptosia nina]|uniref:Prostaglandin reductase 1 n=1 Tax=Leptosia nina TaxID=320188 RepID=A0AAV1JEE7_9NEOP